MGQVIYLYMYFVIDSEDLAVVECALYLWISCVLHTTYNVANWHFEMNCECN